MSVHHGHFSSASIYFCTLHVTVTPNIKTIITSVQLLFKLIEVVELV